MTIEQEQAELSQERFELDKMIERRQTLAMYVFLLLNTALILLNGVTPVLMVAVVVNAGMIISDFINKLVSTHLFNLTQDILDLRMIKDTEEEISIKEHYKDKYINAVNVLTASESVLVIIMVVVHVIYLMTLV